MYFVLALAICSIIPSFAHALVNIVNVATGKYLDSNGAGNAYALNGNGEIINYGISFGLIEVLLLLGIMQLV